MDYSDCTFEGGTVELDGSRFTRCVFRKCEIIFRGGMIAVDGCDFDGCNYQFHDAAARTLEFVQALGSKPEGRKLMEQIFNRPAPPSSLH